MAVIVPYHFVPLSKWVNLPDWGHLISHDIPFEDGLCGSIKYTLINQSPLLVGGHHKKNDDGSTNVQWAKDADGKPQIPGSSIKGMLRSVMEIATFSKMGAVEDKSLAYRDFNNADYNRTLHSTKTEAGWIKYCKETQMWTYKTVDHSVIFNEDLNESCYVDNNIDHIDKAIDKYAKINLNHEITFSTVEASTTHDPKRTRAENIGAGHLFGNVIFADKRVGAESKDYLRYNTVFHVNDNQYKEIKNTKAIKDFFDFHNPDLISYLKNNPHQTFGIPAFFCIDTRINRVKAIGIAKLPKISYDNSVVDLVKNQQSFFNHQASYDMTEGLMGCVRDLGFSLKSRLSFTDAKIIKDEGFTKEINKVLMSPRESYLGAYIEGQNTSNIFRGYNNNNDNQILNKIKGLKIYPRNKKFDDSNTNASKSMVSEMKFVKKDSEFTGEILFHNLKPKELGALLWCLTLGNDEECYHGLGHAKPYGAGNVQITVNKLEVIPNNPEAQVMNTDVASYIHEFETHMEKQHFTQKWKDSPQIQHLLSFAKLNDANLRYMPLEKAVNSYNECNKENEVLMDWKNLKRTEETGDIFPQKFKAGRLERFLDDKNSLDARLRANEADQVKQLKERALLNNLSENGKKIYNLQQFLKNHSEVTVQNPAITSLLKESIDGIKNWDPEDKQILLNLIENKKLCDFIPKKKPNMKKQRALRNYIKRKDLVDKLKQLINDG